LPGFGGVCFLDDSHSDGNKIESQWSFDVHFLTPILERIFLRLLCRIKWWRKQIS
jgi:hypothetical protein